MSTISKFLATPAGQQVARFVRLFAITLVPQVVALQGNYGRSVILSTIVGAAEVAYRQVYPAKP